MISAQIKRGNSFYIDSLEDTLLQIVVLPETKPLKPIKFSFFQFVCHLSELCLLFVKHPVADLTFNMFIIDHYMSQHDRHSEVYRHLMGLTQSWKRFIDVHQDAKMFLSLLNDSRNNKAAVREFLKIRKTILKSLNQKIMADISVTHSDMLTICHLLHQEPHRHKVIKRINDLFISLKRKLLNTAKIDGAVACEFFMNAFEDGSLVANPLREIKAHQNEADFEESRKDKCQYNISFSDEFGSFHQKTKQSERRTPVFDRFEDLEDEWERDHNVEFGFSEARMSLKGFFEKDRDMDAKLKDSGIIKVKSYPDGWDEFLKTNQNTKQKLLNSKVF